jgi:hypothetical protein
MSKQFIKGNIYVFTKKKYMEDVRKYQNKAYIKRWMSGWVKDTNGNEVTVLDGQNGITSSGMYVNPEWCKCIKNNNPTVETNE